MLKKYATSVSNCVCYALVALCVTLFSSNAYAVGATDTISTEDLMDSVLVVAKEWLCVGVSIGASVYCVFVGWNLLRRFLNEV